ncbi:helix-turn-helix domain-containing protein [Mycobacteroides abscessus]|uniref:helix-turn-helix domain-containing protein n=1 Tax=Mycobacteroides abscessus TaxID=36809 RepID=UPI000C265B12|nr:helix-turn-helix transcriptional regulator [Mycobacteroides abscessus]
MQENKEDPVQAVETGFGERVREARIVMGLTQRQLAERLDLDASAVSRLEQGARTIRLGEAALIAGVLNVELSELVFGTVGPAAEFRRLRNAADNAMYEAREHAVLMVYEFIHIYELLERHPELLGTIESSSESTLPATIEEYFDWVQENMNEIFLDRRNFDRVHIEDDWLRRRLESLVEATFQNVASEVPIPPLGEGLASLIPTSDYRKDSEIVSGARDEGKLDAET